VIFSIHDKTHNQAGTMFDRWLTELATALGSFVGPDYFMDGLLIDGDQVTGI